MSTTSPRIAVVGLGVAGGAVATLLTRAGASVTLFEQAPSPGPVGTGFLLQPSGRAVLARMGLLESVLAHSHAIVRFRARHAPGKELTSLAMDAHGVARGVLFSSLTGAATEAGAAIVPGTRIAGFSEDDAGATLTDGEGRKHGPFDLVVAADGARSAIRRQLDGSGPTLSPYGALWAIGEGDGACPHELLQETRGTRTLCGLLPVDARRRTFFAGVKADDFERVKATGYATFADDIARLFPEAETLVRSLGDFSAFMFARYGHGTPRRKHSRRVILIGDAAHPMSPHLGQGANLALCDAEALATAITTFGPGPEAFADHDRKRLRHDAFYVRMSRLLAPTFQSDFTFLGPARDLALPLMTAIPPVRRLMENTLAGGRRGLFAAAGG